MLSYLPHRSGNLEDIKAAGSLQNYVNELHKKFGPMASFWWGKQLVVSLGSPEVFEDITTLFNRPGNTLISNFNCLLLFYFQWKPLLSGNYLPCIVVSELYNHSLSRLTICCILTWWVFPCNA